MAQPSIYAITNPIVRFAQGMDDGNRELLESAFTEDATFDLRPMSKAGAATTDEQPKVIKGRKIIVSLMIKLVSSGADTTHAISNFQIVRAWDEAGVDMREVTCYALASHFKKGEGLDASKDGYHMGNRYRVEVVRMRGEVDEAIAEDRWRIKTFVLSNDWKEGDPSIMGHS